MAFLSCATVQTADGLLDSADLFATHLLRGPDTEVVLASLRINFGTPEMGAAVMRALAHGQPVGEVALRINSLSAYGPASFVCLGDPEVRVPARAVSRTAADAAWASRAPVLGPAPASAPRLLFAADLLADLGTTSSSTRQALRLAAGRGGSADDLSALDRQLLTALVHHADRLADLVGVWSARCLPDGKHAPAACPRCSGAAIEETWSSALYRGYARMLRRCRVHGVLAEQPTGAWPGPDWLATDADGIGILRSDLRPTTQLALVPPSGPLGGLSSVLAVADGHFAVAHGIAGLAAGS